MTKRLQRSNLNVHSMVSFSIVSHGQGNLIKQLLRDLQHINDINFEVVVTLNIPEDESYLEEASGLPLKILRNKNKLGFGCNHNQAFRHSEGDIFVVLNPDLRIQSFDFALMTMILQNPNIGAWAPQVLSPSGTVEDSARRSPTLIRLARRVLKKTKSLDYENLSQPTEVDWIAGMFVAFRRDAYQCVNGFDEKYFMYLEDADICSRLRQTGRSIIIDPRLKVVHDAQRASHRKINHLYWHISSLAKFLFLSKKM